MPTAETSTKVNNPTSNGVPATKPVSYTHLKRLLSFEEFAKGAQPEALFTLVHSIVDRIYITTDGTKQKCQVYIKGCATEDYSDVLGAAGYIEEEPLLPVASYVPPMCDLDYYSIVKSLFITSSVLCASE